MQGLCRAGWDPRTLARAGESVPRALALLPKPLAPGSWAVRTWVDYFHVILNVKEVETLNLSKLVGSCGTKEHVWQ